MPAISVKGDIKPIQTHEDKYFYLNDRVKKYNSFKVLESYIEEKKRQAEEEKSARDKELSIQIIDSD